MHIHRTTRLAGTLGLAALAASPALGQDAPVLDGLRSPQRSTEALPVPLAVDRPTLFAAEQTHRMPRLAAEFFLAEDLMRESDGETRMRTGIIQPAMLDASLDGTWSRLDDGRQVWTLEVHAPDAVGLRLRIDHWEPVPGSELIVYSPNDLSSVQGPIGADSAAVGGALWTPTIWDETVRLEYVLPRGLEDLPDTALLRIDGVLNCYNGPEGPRAVGGTPTPGSPLSCHLDWRCFGAWEDEGDGVALYHYVDDGFGGFICSGGMLNRAPADFTPTFMTAWHCGVRDNNVTSMEVYWDFQTAVCNGAAPSIAGLPRSFGVAVLVNDSGTDWTLVGLSNGGPGGTTFLGWDANYLADNSSTTGIHHPRGSFRRITFFTKSGDGTSCIPADAFFGSQLQGNGEIEPGSSGSPLFDSSGRVRGTASCASWSCSGTNGVSHGRFDIVFPELEPFLLPPDVQVWVDNSYGGSERGTSSQPFSTFLKGVFSVRSGDVVQIDGGTYSGATTISKPMTLRSTGGTVTITN